MKTRLLAVLVLLILVLPLGLAQASTSGCQLSVDLYGCTVVSPSGSSGAHALRLDNNGAFGLYSQSRSTTGIGAFGYASATNGSTKGVQGQSGSTSGIGVFGYANATSGNTIGVYGHSESPSGTGVRGQAIGGTGVYAESSTGFAMWAVGSTSQSRDKSGWVKALVRMGGGNLLRCYNSQSVTPNLAETCNSFSITGVAGDYTITFPFQVDDRYVVVTAESQANSPRCCMLQYNSPATNQVRVRTWDENGTAIDRAFSLVIF